MKNPVALTTYEQALIADAQLLLAKNAIIAKVCEVFSGLSEQFAELASSRLPAAISQVPPRIFKGEQYLQLPYVMLDYPRVFAKEETFAIRTMFWWGNYFSIHLQLSGEIGEPYVRCIQQHWETGRLNDWYYGVHKSEWHHHFGDDNYKCIGDLTASPQLIGLPFIKLAKKTPLSEWDNIQDVLRFQFDELLSLLTV